MPLFIYSCCVHISGVFSQHAYLPTRSKFEESTMPCTCLTQLGDFDGNLCQQYSVGYHKNKKRLTTHLSKRQPKYKLHVDLRMSGIFTTINHVVCVCGVCVCVCACMCMLVYMRACVQQKQRTGVNQKCVQKMHWLYILQL